MSRLFVKATSLAAICLTTSFSYADNEAVLDNIRITAKDDPLTEISTKKLLRMPGAGNDPLRAIEALPGVTFTTGRRAEPAVRGSSPDDNRYIIDFMPVLNIFHFDGSSLLNDNVIENFTLEAAAFDAQYNDATGAVIEANSRAPYTDRKQAVIDFSLLKAGILLETPITENSAAYLSVRQSLIHLYIENLLDDDDFQFTTVPEYYDYQAKYQIQLSGGDTLSIQALGTRDKAGLLFDDESDQIKREPGLAGGIKFNSHFHSQGIVLENTLSETTQLKTGFSHMLSDFSLGLGLDNNLKATSNDYTLRTHLSTDINLNHTLRTGIDIFERQIDFKGDFTAPPCDLTSKPYCPVSDSQERIVENDNLKIYNYDVFIADDWFVSPTLTLTPGVLWSYDDYSEQTFTQGKFKLRWEFIDYWWLNTAWGQYHKFTDNFGEVAKGFGNPDLRQSTSDHYTLGVEHQIDESTLIKLDTYYKTFGDLIISRQDKDTVYPTLTEDQYQALPRYTNDADGDAYGFELFINKSFSEGWYGWLSAAYSETRRHNKITGEDFKYAYDQPWIINLVSNHELNEDWTIGFKWRYQSGQLITPIIDTRSVTNPDYVIPIYGELNSKRLADSHKLDIRLDRNYQYKSWNMDLYVEALNVYNQANVTSYEYNADYTEKDDVTGLPTIISFGIKANL
ncbi:TonB-dependent receptor [Oleispira antarctica RB-8]|uniref:TonB-dependent receptor n=1 Tax=Oleispira antarctica RB-8 TaxID=698738 RepID=R4YPQ1_OLEAN|nr:TonB-dependent receptor [Oleispira antarctica RB-8]